MGNRLQVTAIGGVVVTVSVGIGLMLWAWFGLNWPFALLAGVASLGVQLPLVAASMRRLKPGRVRLPSASAALAPSTHAGPSFHAAPPFHAGAADPALASRLEAVEAGLRTLAQRIWQIDQRITELDRQALERTRDTVAAVASELDMVGSVVRDLAEAVALHEAELFAGPSQPSLPHAPKPLQATRDEPLDSRAPAVEPPVDRPVPTTPQAARGPVAEPAAAQRPAPAPTPVPTPAPLAAPVQPPPAPQPPPVREASNVAKRAVVTGAGIDLFLQSVVTLPQRKIRLYEALPRVKEVEGGATQGDELAEIAWRLGVSSVYDINVLRQVVKVIRHLAAREREVAVVCPVSLASLADRGYFEVLSDLVSEGQSVGTRLVLRIAHDPFLMASPGQIEAMDAVRALGVKLLVDGVEDLRIDPHGLARRGIRFVKVPAALLLAAAEGTVPAEIHPADLAGFLTRQGIAMIVCEVENEEMALELMDYGATLGQGDVFAGPRPVRKDVITQDPPPLPEAQAAQEAAAASAQQAAPPPEAPPKRASLRSFLRRTTA